MPGCRRCISDASRWRGLTLVELLVALGLVAVLIAIAIPALRGMRTATRRTKTLVNLRTIIQTFDSYHTRFDAYPFAYGGPAFADTSNPFVFGWTEMWWIRQGWPVLMHQVAPWPSNSQAWVSPGADATRWARTWGDNPSTFTFDLASYEYSTSFVADPRVWIPGSAVDASLVRAMSSKDVVFPSQKVLMFDREKAYFATREQKDREWPVGMADASARVMRPENAGNVTQNPLRSEPPELFHDTLQGLRGVDVQ